ncbi:hypothetical protein H2204_005294 [Knufia peltigerae]|uniref:Major facilitator superfamily (MFS) profile domain-containing protein n=1 Tax=Knufia peltigerae TaxID=1002370 RepID=A0AA39CXP3_9EURO|nr:hypothetical protein H2204_005294 [Knufia peltigerae]
MTSAEMEFPLGTIKLEELTRSHAEIILHPTPTDDPNDPLNWSRWRKAINFSLVNFYVLMTFVLVDIGVVAYGPYADIGISYGTINDGWALNYAGLAVGCILFIPFVYKYGRRPVYLFSMLFQMASTIWNAKLNSGGELLAAYCLAGLGGAISETIVQITITDLFFVHQRATANGIFITMQNVGSYLGPVAAGYVVTGQGWRWMWWWSAIILAINLVLVIFFFEETSYTPNLIGHDATTFEDTDEQHPKSIDANGPSVKPKEFSGQNDDQAANVHDSVTSVERQDRYKPRTYRERMAFITRSPETEHEFKRHFYQPAIILFTFPAVLYAAIAYGTLLSWYSVLSTVESENFLHAPYNWNASQIGLFNLSPFIGSVVGAIIGGPLNDKAIMWLARRNDGIYEPEMRLWMAIPTIIICPAGILIFGIGLAHVGCMLSSVETQKG